tara:strand:+ start:666 stop:983 length:318 start_codon:yes stop_codon:yes gene_type:complete
MILKLYQIDFDDNTKLITKNIGEFVGEYNSKYNTKYNIQNIRYKLQRNNLEHIVKICIDNLYDKLKPEYNLYLEKTNRPVNNDRTKNRIYDLIYNEYVYNMLGVV